MTLQGAPSKGIGSALEEANLIPATKEQKELVPRIKNTKKQKRYNVGRRGIRLELLEGGKHKAREEIDEHPETDRRLSPKRCNG